MHALDKLTYKDDIFEKQSEASDRRIKTALRSWPCM